jgi:hypothetical protein
MDYAKDVVLAIFGAGVGLAGVVLVFMGFVSAHGEEFQSNDRKRVFKRIAKFGLVPFTLALLSASFSLCWLERQNTAILKLATLTFQFSLISTLLYGIISVMFFL